LLLAACCLLPAAHVEVLQMRKESIPAVGDGEPTAAAAVNEEVAEDVHMSD
jgi:hypothetical protein